MNLTKRTTLATLIGGAAAAVSFSAFARRGHGGHHGPMDPAQLEQHLERMLKHLYVEIDATEAQKQKLDPIVKDAAKELAPMRRSLHEARREAINLLAQDKVDASAIEALRARQMQLADQASRRFTKALVDAADVLNPEQRKKLAAHFARRGRGRWMHG
jgi:Spy/CpxP family protein refolding chaperone